MQNSHLLGQVASTLRGVQNLVVEHREVQGQTQPDGVCGGKIDQGNILQYDVRLAHDHHPA